MAMLIILSCKKEDKKEDQTYCWQLVDALGNETIMVCNKTEAEMAAHYPASCSYYKAGGETFCWMVNGQVFIKDKSVEGMDHLKHCLMPGAVAVKVNCNYCKKFYSRIKQTYKPTNTTQYSPVKFEQYCGDTASKLYDGREVIIKDTPDSLILVQFSIDGSF